MIINYYQSRDYIYIFILINKSNNFKNNCVKILHSLLCILFYDLFNNMLIGNKFNEREL